MEKQNDLVVVRHGETEWSRSGQHTGRTNLELTELGQRQALAVGGPLRKRAFALVLTSLLRRASDTARLAGYDGADHDDDLMEWDYGAYEGLTTKTIREQVEGWTIWRDGAPGGETADQITARVDRTIARARAADGDTLVFAHGHLLRVLAARWIGLPVEGGRLFALGAASLSVLGYEHEWPVIERWNDRTHLDE